MNNDKKNNNVEDIFARQIAALELDDELDATKIDLDMMDTFEDDFVKTDDNLTKLNELYEVSFDEGTMISKLKEDKSQSIYDICNGINNNVQFSIPKHIESVINWFKNEKN